MKQIFFTLAILLLHVSIFADELNTLFEDKKYQECYDKALSEYRFDNPSAQLTLSRCAQKLGLDNMAIASLERVLFIEPNNIKAMFELSQIYHRLELEKQKNLITSSLKSYQLTPEQRTRLNTLSLAKEEKLSLFSASVTFGGGYDTNLNILPTEDVVESSYLRFTTALSYVHELSQKGGWFALANLKYIHQLNESEHFYDMDFLSLSSGVGYKFSNSTISVPLYYKRLIYLKEDLVHEFGIKPNIDIALDKTFILSLNTELSKREFKPNSYSDGDFEMIGGEMGGLWIFGADFIYLKTNYKHFIASKNQKTLFTAKDNYYIATGANYNFNKKLSSKLNYLFRYNDYDNTFIADTKRHDKNHTISINAEYKLSKNIKTVASYKYSSNVSNYSPANYHKQVSEVFIQYDY